MEGRHENTSGGERLPSWYDGKKIDEVQFCSDFLGRHPMKCVHGRLFTVDGAVEDEGGISRMILEEVSGCLSSGISKAVTNLLAALKLMAYSPPLPIETDRIHVANGTYFLNGSFTEDKAWCSNRLKVRYEPNAPKPERWLGFLSELLEPEDIPTLQEYLGYCLIPSTKGQKMLLLIGKGGEGKSRIGLVMRSLLGDSMNMTSIQKVENNRFSRADLENKLLMVDDDMDMSALPKTNYIKSIVTAECKMDLERKGVQSYQSRLYARFLCFGNGALTALHDRSDGFFRRQIVLTTRDRPAGRVDDPFLAEKLADEAEGIFLWCLEGLRRLLANNYRFSLSAKARENVETVTSSNSCAPRATSASGPTQRPARGRCTRPTSSGARTTCASRSRQTASARSLRRTRRSTRWRPRTTSTPPGSGCGNFTPARHCGFRQRRTCVSAPKACTRVVEDANPSPRTRTRAKPNAETQTRRGGVPPPPLRIACVQTQRNNVNVGRIDLDAPPPTATLWAGQKTVRRGRCALRWARGTP